MLNLGQICQNFNQNLRANLMSSTRARFCSQSEHALNGNFVIIKNIFAVYRISKYIQCLSPFFSLFSPLVTICYIYLVRVIFLVCRVSDSITRKLQLVACHPWSIFLSLCRHSTDIAQPFHVDLEVVGVRDMLISLTPSQLSIEAAFISVVLQIHGAGGHLTIGDVVLICCYSNRCAVTWRDTKTKHSSVINLFSPRGNLSQGKQKN